MKKQILAFALVLLAVLSACSGEKAPSYKDGVYFAQQETFAESGWKYMVTLEVKNGSVASVSWNGANVDAGMDKISVSKAGRYPMVEKGGAKADWHVQSKLVEDHFLKTQSTAMPDAISGASIHYNEFYELVNKALAAGPSGYGPYKDGTYHAEQPEFGHGYKYFVDLTVVSGYVVAANWDAYAEAEGAKNKQAASKDGEYGMVEKGGAQAPWWEQARVVEDYFINTQDPSQPDAISGATIGLEEFYSLVNEALKNAKR